MAMNIVRIGYQGEEGSNSLEAAKRIVRGHDFGTCDFLGLVSSIHVVESLLAGFCDYGVVAVRNSFAGDVKETIQALEGTPIHLIDRYRLSVNHCLFKLPNTPQSQLSHVSSHPQAIAQTRNNRELILPGLIEEPTPDTAISARWLKAGALPPTTAVICSKEAGRLHGLELIAEGIQDSADNCTEFVLLKPDYEASRAITNRYKRM